MFRSLPLSALAALVLFAYSTHSSAQEAASCLGVTNGEPKISGLYVDSFGGWHWVGSKAWLSFGSGNTMIFHLCKVEDTHSFTIAQNDQSNQYNPGKFSRFEWFNKNGKLFYCQQVFDASTSTDAADFTKTPAADTSDPDDKGCGAGGRFPWSGLSLIRR